MAGEKGGAKADTLVKVVLFFFISLLSFSVGTFVGKQVSDSDHRRLALEGEYSGKQAANEASDDDAKISEKEVEALTEEFVAREKNREPASAEGHGAAKHDDHGKPAAEQHSNEGYKSYSRDKKVADHGDSHSEKAAPKKEATEAHDSHAKPAKATQHEAAPKAAVKPDATSHVASKVVEGKAPSDGAHEERKPTAALPSVASSSVGKFTLQVASYATEKEAKNHASDLKGKGWDAFYLSAQVNGAFRYRVHVGLFSNSDGAKEFRDKFMKEANTKSAIVHKIVQ